MLELSEIKDLMQALEHSTLNRLKLKYSDGEIVLEKNSCVPIAAGQSFDKVKSISPALIEHTQEKTEEITATMVGTFYS